MNDARDRRTCTRADIGNGAGNGARGDDPAEERREEIGHALRHQLLIRIVPVIDEAVGNTCAQ